jgi:hypothetical protein
VQRTSGAVLLARDRALGREAAQRVRMHAQMVRGLASRQPRALFRRPHGKTSLDPRRDALSEQVDQLVEDIVHFALGSSPTWRMFARASRLVCVLRHVGY